MAFFSSFLRKLHTRCRWRRPDTLPGLLWSCLTLPSTFFLNMHRSLRPVPSEKQFLWIPFGSMASGLKGLPQR